MSDEVITTEEVLPIEAPTDSTGTVDSTKVETVPDSVEDEITPVPGNQTTDTNAEEVEKVDSGSEFPGPKGAPFDMIFTLKNQMTKDAGSVEETTADSIKTEQKPSSITEIDSKELEEISLSTFLGTLASRARATMLKRKIKKAERIMVLFGTHKEITNTQVRKFLRVSHATAGRYLAILEKEGKITQNGKTGHAVTYSKI